MAAVAAGVRPRISRGRWVLPSGCRLVVATDTDEALGRGGIRVAATAEQIVVRAALNGEVLQAVIGRQNGRLPSCGMTVEARVRYVLEPSDIEVAHGRHVRSVRVARLAGEGGERRRGVVTFGALNGCVLAARGDRKVGAVLLAGERAAGCSPTAGSPPQAGAGKSGRGQPAKASKSAK